MSSLNSLWQEKGGLDEACWLWMPWLGSDTCHFYHSPLVETIDMLPSHLESFLGGSAVNNPPAMQETPVWFPGSGSSPGERIGYPFQDSWASLVAQMVKNLPAMQETWVQSWVGKIPRRKAWQPTTVFLPGVYLWTEDPVGVAKSRTWLSD